ncbi:MAG: hypothetical protein ABI972_15145 [Acidobacteriota bacterium]
MTRFARRQFLAACGAIPLAAQQAAPARSEPTQSSQSQPSQTQPAPRSSPSPSWNQVFFHDADEQQLSILEIAFYSNRAAMAIALLSDRGRVKPASLRTTDSGVHWTLGELKPTALSVQFLDEANGWMAATNGIYKSTDAGQSWRRVVRNSEIRHVRFADRERGYAAGGECTALETIDGGKSWKPIEAASSYKANKDRINYRWIELANTTMGFIVGSYDPVRPYRRDDLPAWIDPESSRRLHRQTPALSLVLQTIDGGKVWKPTSSSIFGHITRLRMGSRGLGLALVEFDDSFDYASEVFLINLSTGKTDRTYREAERAITDVLIRDDGSFWMAGVESPGRLRTSPIPAKVHILKGDGGGNWIEMEVDYRATARRVRFAESPTGQLFACTDTGMILHLGTPPAKT